MDPTPEAARPAPFGSRRGMSFGERVRAEESYGILFLLIIVSLTVTAAFSGSDLARATSTLLFGGVLLFALWTSRTGGTYLRAALVLVPVLIVVVFVSGPGSAN